MCQTVSLAGQCNAGAAMTCCPGQIGEEATATCEKRAALFAQTGGEPWREVAEKCYDDSGGRVSRLQCAPQGAQTGAGTALQLCAVQGMVNAPQVATPMTIHAAAARMGMW